MCILPGWPGMFNVHSNQPLVMYFKIHQGRGIQAQAIPCNAVYYKNITYTELKILRRNIQVLGVKKARYILLWSTENFYSKIHTLPDIKCP